MNAHFHQTFVMASSGGGSNKGFPGFGQAIDGNLNCQIKTPGGLCLKAENRLPIVLKQSANGKSEEIKYSMNCTKHTKSHGNSTVLLYVQVSYAALKNKTYYI